MAVTINGSTGVVYEDNIKHKLGTGDDLEIYHDGSHSYISDTGTGYLILKSSETQIQSSTGEDMAKFHPDGTVELYHNNAKKLETISTGLNVTGGIRLGGNNAVNELDDYEEGTWTPEVKIETRAASDSPIDNVEGAYTKVGKLVTCHGKFLLNGTPSETSTSRAMEIHGFPFDHGYDWDKVSNNVRVTGWETGNTYGTDIYFLLRMLSGYQYCRLELMQQSYNGTRNGSVIMQDNMQVVFTFSYITV